MNDIINGLFESVGFVFILPSIIKLYRDKEVKGVSWVHSMFFWSWGAWNLYYYPSLGQWMSFYGGVLLLLANTIWMSQLIFYTYYKKHLPQINSFTGSPETGVDHASGR